MDSILLVTFEENGKSIERVYDFRLSEGRKAFLRFASWALAEKIQFTCKSAATA